MAEILTPEQQQAVENRGGKLLVSAAAGSGKTKVLVDRLLKYITDPFESANIDEFLIITYTKAAASELRGKIAAKLTEHIANDPTNRHLQRQLQRLYLTKISTVHAFCADILRQYAYMLDISSDFHVGDENECLQLRVRAMEQILESTYDNITASPDIQAFLDTQGLGRSDALVPEIIEQVYDSARCHLDPDRWCADCIENASAENIRDPSETVWGRYLMQDLFRYIDHQISAFRYCVHLLSSAQGLEKQLALLQNTINQLHFLRQSDTWDDIISRKDIDFGRLTFPKKANDPTLSEQIKAIRIACKEGLEKKLRYFSDGSHAVLEDLNRSTPAARGLIALVNNFAKEYTRLKQMHHVLDFSDLEQKTLDLLLGKKRSSITAVANEVGQQFREIMVDEYQDSNSVQDAIFTALTQKRQNLFMVGDVKQSIYQFRLADPGIFLEKYSSYVPVEQAEDLQGRKITLSSNFRSGKGVIDAVNDVFQDCVSEQVGGLAYGNVEALKEGIPHIPLDEEEVCLYCIDVQEDTYEEEASFVADEICKLLDGKHSVRDGEKLRQIVEDDIVILLRSPGSVGMEFQYALEQRGVQCSGSIGVDLLLTEEVSTLRALLQVISNPRQDIPLIAVLASPVFGFSADDLAQIRAEDKKSCFYDVMVHSVSPKCTSFIHTLNLLRKASATSTLPELLERILNLTQLDMVYGAMEHGHSRRDNLHSFYQLAVEFSNHAAGDLDRFILHLDTLEKRGLAVTPEQASGGCVRIMSIHKSKGLEFPVVFLCGLSRRFNQENLREQVLCHKELGLGLSCVDSENRIRYPTVSKHAIAAKLAADSLSEELRVLYVAMTRARDRLIMTYASQNLQKDIHDIALRMLGSEKELMTLGVSNPGQWILYSALHRIEANELFSLCACSGKPEARPTPWRINVVQSTSVVADTTNMAVIAQEPHLNEDTLNDIRDVVSCQYAYDEATKTPSKQTATQRKGRIKDVEASEHADSSKKVSFTWRRPSFISQQYKGAEYGNAIHAVLQYIRYDMCVDEESVSAEISRLVDERYITPEQGNLADSGKLAAFFRTGLGKKIREGKQVLREFKFSILDNASEYGNNLDGERILLQGVVDCAIIETDGITIVDFKTDYVTDETLPQVVQRYMAQIQTYAEAMQRIYELPVKEKALYFFCIDKFVWL